VTAAPRSRLAICLFTHDGRRDVLAQALSSVLTQISDRTCSDVEVCVTDNASNDGTEALLAELKRTHGERLRYVRHERNLGLSRNLLACVELARSEYCWILTSDDAIEHGGIARALDLIASAEHRPCGLVVNKANFDSELVELAGQGGSAFYPPEQRRTVQYADADRFISDCGLLTSLVSTLIVRRENWLAALAELGGEDFADSTIFPHLPIIATMARHDPRWVWCPAKLVRVRMDNAFLASDEGWSVDQIHTRLLGDMNRMWIRQRGWRDRVRLSLMRRAFDTFVAPGVLLETAPAGRSLRARIALLRTYAAIFWWLPDFWLGTARSLVFGHGRLTLRATRAPHRPLSLEQRVAQLIVTSAPAEAPPSHEIGMRLQIRNVSGVELVPGAPRGIVVGYRWHARDGEVVLQGPPTPLPRRLAPAERLICEQTVLTPTRPGVYRLQLALAQLDVGWFDDRDPALACWATIEVRNYGWAGRPSPA
jgi:glycosyltransferase involved in cell wall biosynthesis